MNEMALLEAVLFVSPKPLSLNEIYSSLNLTSDNTISILSKLNKKYDADESGIELVETSNGWKLEAKSEYTDKISHFSRHTDLSKGELKTLSLITFKEPIKQSDIVKIQGNKTYSYVKSLIDRKLVNKTPCCRTKLLKTTREFEEYFGIDIKKIKEKLKKEFKNENNKNIVN